MRLTILLITEPAEEARLSKSLRAAYRLRLRGDLDESLPTAEQLLREQPDAILLSMGPGAAAYAEAAREYLPGCAVCLLCERGDAERARELRPNALFLRPVKLTELLTALEAMSPGHAAPEPPPRRRPTSSAGLLRVDDMLLDPFSLFGAPADTAGAPADTAGAPADTAGAPAPEPARAAPGPQGGTGAPDAPGEARARAATASGQFRQLVVVPEELLDEAQAASRKGKVAVDPALYEDALSDIDVETLGEGPPEGTAARAAAPTLPARPHPAPSSQPPPLPRAQPPTPPPTPGDAGHHRRRTDPPASPAAGPPPVPAGAALPRRTTQPPEPPPPAREPPQEARTAAAAPPPPEGDRPPAPPPPEGDLQAADPPTLIGWLCTSGYSGSLELNRDGETAHRSLYFDGGELVAASSRLPVDSLPELLYHEGRLSREQLKRARHLQESAAPDVTNRRLAQLLADEQLLPKGEIAPLLRRHVIEIFYRSFAWEKGRYRLLQRSAPPEDRVRLKETPRLLLLEGLRRKASLESLLQRVGPDSTILVPVQSGGLLLKDAGVTAFEQRALPLFDGRHSLQQIARQSGLAEHATYVLAYALICLGGLRRPREGAGGLLPAEAPRPPEVTRGAPTEPARAEPPRPPPQGAARGATPEAPRAVPGREPRPAPPETPRVPSGPSLAERTARARERLREKQRHAAAADYFTLLDLPERAGGEDVRRAHAALQEELADDRLPQELLAEFGAALHELREVVSEAHMVLASDELRAAYRAQLLPLPEEPLSSPKN